MRTIELFLVVFLVQKGDSLMSQSRPNTRFPGGPGAAQLEGGGGRVRRRRGRQEDAGLHQGVEGVRLAALLTSRMSPSATSYACRMHLVQGVVIPCGVPCQLLKTLLCGCCAEAERRRKGDITLHRAPGGRHGLRRARRGQRAGGGHGGWCDANRNALMLQLLEPSRSPVAQHVK